MREGIADAPNCPIGFCPSIGKHPPLLGTSSATKQLFEDVRHAARYLATVLLRGETGVGKDLVARTLHAHSARADRPFVAVNCAALPDLLLESELFGHVRGAFTGAVHDRAGLVVEAEGGTLFLDELDGANLPLQGKLLRVLETSEYRAVGDSAVRMADVRFVAATNKNLERLVREGKFREDLYFRLKVIVIEIPSLRERRDDIPVLVDSFLEECARKYGKAPVTVTPQAMAMILSHPWPGNVRELRNCVESRFIMDRDGTIDADDVADFIGTAPFPAEPAALHLPAGREKLEIECALTHFCGNKSAVCRELRIARSTLDRLLKLHGIDARPYRRTIRSENHPV